MAKVTSKLQVTLPKRIAEQHGIQPGDDIEFQSAGPVIRIIPSKSNDSTQLSIAERLRLFDDATVRQRERASRWAAEATASNARDWTRDDLYQRGSDD